MTNLFFMLLAVAGLFAVITVLVDRMFPKKHYAKYAPAAVAAYLALYNLVLSRSGAGRGFDDLARFAFVMMVTAGFAGALVTAVLLARANRK